MPTTPRLKPGRLPLPRAAAGGLALLLVGGSGLALGAPPPAFVRPVSLHAVTDHSVVIAAETAAPASLRVEAAPLGTFTGTSTRPITSAEPGPVTRHLLTLSGLAANTAYSYTVSGPAGSESGSFWTAPAAGSTEPFTFAVVGDSRDHGAWAEVAHSILEKKPRLVLVTGDDVERGGVESDWDDYFRAGQDLFANTVVFTVRGNHDVGGGYEEHNPVPAGASPLYYAFDYGSARFLALDTNQAADAAMLAFAQKTLLAPRPGPMFVFHHHPLYSCGVHGSSPRLQELYQPLFERGRVTLDVAGHDHDLEQWEPVGGVQYAVSGGGGTFPYPLHDCRGPFARAQTGYLMVSVSGTRVVETFYDSKGETLYTSGPLGAQATTSGAPR